ncbi:MAG: GIDE domain-containing protein [Candidatus Micrarchaeota archaeon]
MASNGPDTCCCGAIFGFVVGMGLLLDGVGKFLLLQKIKNTPTSKVRSVAIGLTEVFGKAKCKENMISPVVRQKCVYHKLVGEYYRSGKHGGWRKIYEYTSMNPFYIEDETGKILVDPKDAEIDIPSDSVYQGYISGKGFFGMQHQQLDKKVLDFIDTLPPAAKSNFMAHQQQDVRVTEYFIAEGDSIYVLGTAEQQKGAASSIGNENLVLKRGRDNTMYINDSSEKKVTDKLGWTYLWEIPVGLIISAICLFLFIASILGTV